MTFHIHVDAVWLTPEFESFLKSDLGFWRTDFVGPDGGPTDPLNHLTLKPGDTRAFKAAFARAVEFARLHHAMEGYIEGETITKEIDFPFQGYIPDIPIPFVLTTTDVPEGSFKQAELHLTLCPERSHPGLLAQLRDMGFAAIFMPKPSGIKLIFTAQGSIPVIANLVKLTVDFLDRAGGAAACDLKQEHIAKWWLSSDILRLPPVVGDVEFVTA